MTRKFQVRFLEGGDGGNTSLPLDYAQVSQPSEMVISASGTLRTEIPSASDVRNCGSQTPGKLLPFALPSQPTNSGNPIPDRQRPPCWESRGVTWTPMRAFGRRRPTAASCLSRTFAQFLESRLWVAGAIRGHRSIRQDRRAQRLALCDGRHGGRADFAAWRGC
jgi:hypothetical protein